MGTDGILGSLGLEALRPAAACLAALMALLAWRNYFRSPHHDCMTYRVGMLAIVSGFGCEALYLAGLGAVGALSSPLIYGGLALDLGAVAWGGHKNNSI